MYFGPIFCWWLMAWYMKRNSNRFQYQSVIREIDIGSLNLIAIEKGLEFAEKMLLDCMNIREVIDQKASHLMNVYISCFTICVSIVAIFTQLSKEKALMIDLKWILAFKILVWLSFIGFALCSRCLTTSDYHIMGKHPQYWLTKGALTASEDQYKLLQAELLESFVDKVETARESNKHKRPFLDLATRIPWLAGIVLIYFSTF